MVEQSESGKRHEVKATDAALQRRTVHVSKGRITSGELFGTTRQLVIVHGDDAYTLRITAQNKLILTK
jgi:hemin uptake protein HemP